MSEKGRYIAHERTRDRLNWKIYELYVSQQIDECLQLIEAHLFNTRGQCEFAIYVKGLISRNRGNISESLELFQASTAFNPRNICNLKQVARSLYLLGRYDAAIEIYDKAQEINFEDWEIWYNKGLCFEHLLKYEECIDCYVSANAVQQHDSTFMRLANIYLKQSNYSMAIETFKEALEFSPESALLLTSLGALYLKINDPVNAFNYLGSSMSLDSSNPTTIIAAASIIQHNQDIDVALIKYRVAALKSPHSSRLWSNIGMCFYAKGKYLESISSFRRAIYLNPFDWAIVYNLGLVHLATGSFVSAFHQFSAAINLNKTYPLLFMYLGVVLSYLNDFENGYVALQRALQLQAKQKIPNNKNMAASELARQCLIHINCCIVLMRRVRDEHNELFEADSKTFQFKDNSVPSFESGDEEQDEYHRYLFEEYTKHKQEAFQHWTSYQNMSKTVDDDTKQTEMPNVGNQESLLKAIFNS
eukprot:CAMPEP_0197031300 /NCGR_PEP_ID=MMETSP1384-20130603/10344_1 /TAXON_ID=29189 /ORGANISM="Ammonia sp." /LENGTH=473 /DNA_ID=CAMNT_0042460807 /DNA_START=46 /DNA_END=1467 /DNA_ORIENTATION=+